jgi:putative phage-type endonuclease
MDRKGWLEWRRGGIGSSDAPIIMGMSPWSTPFLLWKEKVYGSPEKKCNSAMERGVELEPIVRDMLENDLCYLLETKNVTHPVYPWMRSSLDAMTLDGTMIFEIKCPGKEDHELAKVGKIPEKYYPQLMHQLACTGLLWITYVSYYQGEYEICMLKRDEEYIADLIRKEMEFWKLVETKTPPEKTSKDYEEKDEDEEWKELVDEWKPLYESLKEMEQREKIIRDRLIVLSQGKNSIGHGVKLMRMECQGHVDWERGINESFNELKKRHPEIKIDPINWDTYRKPAIQKFRLSLF